MVAVCHEHQKVRVLSAARPDRLTSNDRLARGAYFLFRVIRS